MKSADESAAATSAIFMICPDSKRIFRLSQAIRGPLHVDLTDPAETEADAWSEFELRRAQIKVLTDAARSQTPMARVDASQEVLAGLPEALFDVSPPNLKWLGGTTWIHYRGMKLETQAEITVEIINAVPGTLDCSVLRSPVPGKNVSADIYRMTSASEYKVRPWDPLLTSDWTTERPK